MKEVQPIKDKRKLQELKEYIKEHKEYKYYVMFMLGIYSGLRIEDILQLQVKDVMENGEMRNAIIKGATTNNSKMFMMSDELQEVLKEYCQGKAEEEYLIQNERTHKPIGRVQAWKVINECAVKVGLEDIGTHSMRKTFGYHFYQETKDLILLQKIFNHSEPKLTRRYIGVAESEKE